MPFPGEALGARGVETLASHYTSNSTHPQNDAFWELCLFRCLISYL